ncbi:alpha/beta hydrolase [Microlunatus aurantiacus]|uniref:Alpha/beta hydrolase n=2 Tax=Microlunatus aurantiacus TaxID=446786 RepID=A0ABP7CRJ0_9ACTN
MRPLSRRLFAMASAMALTAGLLSVSTAPAADAATSSTSKVEKRRSKAVKTPKLKWYTCYGYAKCATVKVPLDYDKPKGKKVELAVLKVPAKNQKRKIGSLFVNPGGPGGSGTEIAYGSPYFLSPAVTDRFDVVGFDPRGVAFSQNVKCFSSPRTGSPVSDKISSVAFPYGAAQEKAFKKVYDKHAKGCSTTGKPLSGAMSTAEVARDMDLLRRAVGDKKLTYLGFSYGSYLGEVYANLYPDRVRALAVDGVLDPARWAGTKKTQSTPIGARLGSAEGASKALNRALLLCDRVGEAYCSFAGGNPVANYEKIAQKLRKGPLTVVDEESGEQFVVTYADFVGTSLGILYSQYYTAEDLTWFASYVGQLTGVTPATAPRQQTTQALITLTKKIKAEQQRRPLPGKRLGFPYDNSVDAFQTIACTDSRNSKNLADFGRLANAADKRAPYFGRLWLWNLAGCSSTKWTVKDEDAYRGPWTKRTSTPVLIVGNYWDPATNYAGALSTSKRLPNSRLLSSNSWGHTAYGTSECVTDAVDTYLLTKKVPAPGKVCTGEYTPFADPIQEDSTKRSRAKEQNSPVAVPPAKPGLR